LTALLNDPDQGAAIRDDLRQGRASAHSPWEAAHSEDPDSFPASHRMKPDYRRITASAPEDRRDLFIVAARRVGISENAVAKASSAAHELRRDPSKRG
jgi:hypothetical protein